MIFVENLCYSVLDDNEHIIVEMMKEEGCNYYLINFELVFAYCKMQNVSCNTSVFMRHKSFIFLADLSTRESTNVDLFKSCDVIATFCLVKTKTFRDLQKNSSFVFVIFA